MCICPSHLTWQLAISEVLWPNEVLSVKVPLALNAKFDHEDSIHGQIYYEVRFPPSHSCRHKAQTPIRSQQCSRMRCLRAYERPPSNASLSASHGGGARAILGASRGAQGLSHEPSERVSFWSLFCRERAVRRNPAHPGQVMPVDVVRANPNNHPDRTGQHHAIPENQSL